MPAPAPQPARRRAAPDFQSLLAALRQSAAAARAPLVGAAEGDCREPEALVADTVHLFAVLHGELPSLIDLIGREVAEIGGALAPAASTFERDRSWLATLSRETGARVDLAGLTDAETATRGLRDAMLTLARSSRNGCAVGTAVAFLTEWPELRRTLDLAGTIALSARWPGLSSEWPADPLAATGKLAAALYEDPAAARAISFGAEQFSLIHAQLLDIVATRAKARAERG